MLALAAAGHRTLAAGERGLVLYSDDCGTRWTQASVPVSMTLTALQFVDPRQGFAVGHGGVVLASRDGGENWTRQLDGRRIAQLALAAAKQKAAADGAAADGQLADAERLVADGPDKPLLAMHFWTAERGIVVGAYGIALTTHDGGEHRNWIADRIPNPKGLHLYGQWVDGDQLVIVGEQGFAVRSNDGGGHFEALKTPYAGSYFGVTGLPGAASAELLVYGLRGHAYRSPVKGAAAFEPLNVGTEASVLSVLPVSADEALAFDADGQIFDVHAAANRSMLVGSSPVGPVLAAVPACGGTVVAGMRGLAVLDPGQRSAGQEKAASVK